MADTDREEYVTLARVGHAFAVVRAARALLVEPSGASRRDLRDAINDLDALDTANHREHSDG